MSGKALGWAREVMCSGGLSAKAVLLLMADFANGEAELFPSVGRMARELQTTDRTVQRAINTLVEDGLIVREFRETASGKTTSSFYRLVLEDGPDPRHSVTPTPDTVSPSPPTQLRGTPDTVSPSTTLEPPLEPGLSDESPVRAREAFDLTVAVWLALNPDRVARPRAWAAWLAAVERTGDPDGLLRAVQRFAAESADAKARKIPALDRWLADEKYLGWIGAAATASVVAMAALWPGPADKRAALVALAREDWVRSWVDPCGWDDDAQAIVCRSPLFRDRIRDRIGTRTLADLGLILALPERTSA